MRAIDWLQLIGWVYVFGFLLGLVALYLMVRMLDEAPDHRERAELNHALHEAGWSRAVVIVFGALLWPWLPILMWRTRPKR